MKKILFAVNTMGRAGAETALIELLNALHFPDYKLYLRHYSISYTETVLYAV